VQAGHSEIEVAKEFGLHPSTVSRDVTWALSRLETETAEERRQLRTKLSRRYLAIIENLTPIATLRDVPYHGQKRYDDSGREWAPNMSTMTTVAVVKVLLQAMKQLGKLHGLEMPDDQRLQARDGERSASLRGNELMRALANLDDLDPALMEEGITDGQGVFNGDPALIEQAIAWLEQEGGLPHVPTVPEAIHDTQTQNGSNGNGGGRGEGRSDRV